MAVQTGCRYFSSQKIGDEKKTTKKQNINIEWKRASWLHNSLPAAPTIIIPFTYSQISEQANSKNPARRSKSNNNNQKKITKSPFLGFLRCVFYTTFFFGCSSNSSWIPLCVVRSSSIAVFGLCLAEAKLYIHPRCILLRFLGLHLG